MIEMETGLNKFPKVGVTITSSYIFIRFNSQVQETEARDVVKHLIEKNKISKYNLGEGKQFGKLWTFKKVIV